MVFNNFDDWAEHYDLIFADRFNDLEFYLGEARKAEGKVLEVGCGTGRIYLGLLKEGIDAFGIDISEEMLRTLKKKALEQGLEPKVAVADMQEFKLEDSYALIVCPGRSFLHNLTIEDQLSALRSIRDHRLTEGKLILNFFFPNPEIMINVFGKEIEQSIVINKEPHTFTTNSYFIDVPNQILEFTSRIMRGNDVLMDGTYRIALIYKREFELLLQLAGFKRCDVFGGFEYQPLESFDQEMVWIIEK
jgi:SAM-dependent methyltransferase